MSSVVNTEHPLGKGEVVSSILTGSTRYAHKYAPFAHWVFWRPAVSGRTEREDDISTRGKSVEFVRESFARPSRSRVLP